MTELRKHMIEDMQLRGLAARNWSRRINSIGDFGILDLRYRNRPISKLPISPATGCAKCVIAGMGGLRT